MCAIDDQAVDDVTLCQIGNRLIDAEHVFAERTAVSPVAHTGIADNELVPGGKEAERIVGLLVEEIALVGIDTCHDGIIFDRIVDEAVEANVFLHYSIRFCAGL